MSQTEAAKSADVREGVLHIAMMPGHGVALTRVAGAVQAFENRCPHLGLKLTKGKVAGGTITCPFHGSTFDICSGRNLDWTNAFMGIQMPGWSHGLLAMGKRPAGLRTYQASERDGGVFVELES